MPPNEETLHHLVGVFPTLSDSGRVCQAFPPCRIQGSLYVPLVICCLLQLEIHLFRSVRRWLNLLFFGCCDKTPSPRPFVVRCDFVVSWAPDCQVTSFRAGTLPLGKPSQLQQSGNISGEEAFPFGAGTLPSYNELEFKM